jgi:hypothetical protein
MSNYTIPDDLTQLDITAAAPPVTPDDELPRPFGSYLRLELGGCDSQLITDREHIAAWGPGLACALPELAPCGQPVIDVFGHHTEPGLTARFRLDQHPGWRGVAVPGTADAVVRCDPATHGCFVDILSVAPFDPDRAATFSVDHFAARTGTGTYTIRRVPSLMVGFSFDWKERP